MELSSRCIQILIYQSSTSSWGALQNILSHISLIFNPLGLLDSITLFAKIMQGISGDSSLIGTNRFPWNWINGSILKRRNLIISILCFVNAKQPICLELYRFSDASEIAYGACIYLACIYFQFKSMVIIAHAYSASNQE